MPRPDDAAFIALGERFCRLPPDIAWVVSMCSSRDRLGKDRRPQPLALTEPGSWALRSAKTTLRERLAGLLADMPPHEADALARLLELLQGSLAGTPPPRRPHRPPPPPPGHGPKHRRHPKSDDGV